jgi:hypothetical protein
MPPDDIEEIPPVRRPPLLRCCACGRAAECATEDVRRYARSGWPVCCGEIMALARPADAPGGGAAGAGRPPAG